MTNETILRDRKELLLKTIIGALVCFYFINCFTPIRLHVDTIRYFAIKDCIEYGCAGDSEAAKDYLPYGYTALLLLLSKLHILSSFTIVLINCIYLAFGLYFINRIFDSSGNFLLCIILLLLNWTTIKFVMHPLSEMQYVFFSMGSLYLFSRFTANKKVMFLIGAFALGGLAFLTRSVGLSLAAALIAGLIWEYKAALKSLIIKNKILVILIIVTITGVLLFSKQLGLDHYTGVMSNQFDEGVTMKKTITGHFIEWAEIGFNFSIVKVPFLPAHVTEVIFLICGIIFLCIIFYTLFFQRLKIPFVVKAYLVFYTVLMFNWPFYDPRFWVPVLPLVIYIITINTKINSFALKTLLGIYLLGYTVMGIASIGYMTYTSFNKKVMVKKHANGVYRNEYETYFFGKPQSDTATSSDPFILSIIERYNK